MATIRVFGPDLTPEMVEAFKHACMEEHKSMNQKLKELMQETIDKAAENRKEAP